MNEKVLINGQEIEITETFLREFRKRAGVVRVQTWEEIRRIRFIKKRGIKDYTCAEIGRMLGRHSDTIYNWFKDYPGVIEKRHPAKRMKDPRTGEWKVKRRHTILLIPPEVFRTWLKEHSKK